MGDWFATYGSRFVLPLTIILGAVAITVIWWIAMVVYRNVPAIAAGFVFMGVGLGLLVGCGYYLVTDSEITRLEVLFNGVALLAGLGALTSGAFGLRNTADF